ncbi:MAG: low molecular weight phosphatase family protein [Petrotogales bacterium]
MKKVLFVCVENACRSQMAKGFFNKFTKDAMADSAGTQPAKNVNPVAVKIMNEVGVDIGNNKPKQLTFDMNNEFDFIVTMGCIDGCPVTPKNKTIEWNVEDPKGKDIDFYRDVRDQIEGNVKKLINEVI